MEVKVEQRKNKKKKIMKPSTTLKLKKYIYVFVA